MDKGSIETSSNLDLFSASVVGTKIQNTKKQKP